jgi:glyoxylase-like metal-dependent hydrolase (beta-lactamase superfamily II)
MPENKPESDGNRPSRRTILGAAGLAATAASIFGTFPAAAAAHAASSSSTAPVPPPAKGPAIPGSGYLVQEIGDRLYWLTDGIYQMMFLVTGEGVVAVDAPPTLGNNILRAIATITRKPVTHAVYSHHHADHTGAMVVYKDAQLWAHRDTAELLSREQDPNRPVPGHTFTDSRTLRVGGQILRLDYHGPNHSPGNLFIWAPSQKVLMLVDVVFPGWVPFAYLAESSDIPGWIAAHEQATTYPFQTYIGGHLTRLGTRSDVETQQEYISELRAQAASAIQAVDVSAIYASVDPANPWAVFRAYLDACASQAANAVVPNWLTRLGGADVYTQSNAYTMVESLRIDTGQLGPFGIHP